MKLEHYKPLGHNIVVEPIFEKELKQGSLYLPVTQRDNSGILAKVHRVGPLCEGVKEGQTILLDNLFNAKLILFEDVKGEVYSVNQHIVLGIFD